MRLGAMGEAIYQCCVGGDLPEAQEATPVRHGMVQHLKVFVYHVHGLQQKHVNGVTGGLS